MSALSNGIGIELKQCGKTFKTSVALGSTTLIIAPGETVVLLGPSGCGKTTLLRIIAGLESPDIGGEVFFDGKRVTELPIEKRNVGMVFQSYALFPNMTVFENIEYGLKIRKLDATARKSRVDDMLAMMQIEALKERQIHQLSGGQRQRVALARAIAPRPKVLLLDEPLTALDAKLRDALRTEINTLLRSLAITAVYVTHDQAEAMALGDRIVVMNKGKIAQVGTAKAIYFNPADAFVAEFIGTLNRIGDKQFRPEEIELCDPVNAVFRGMVTSSQFLGDHCCLTIKVEEGCIVTAKLSTQYQIDVGAEVGFQILHRRQYANCAN
jgi:putative spermidine/putrescine transport system ATP-binding protein